MTLRKYANRRDASEPAIVQAFESMGASVYRMDKPCDLLCGFLDRTHLVEVKTPGTHYGKSLNDNQKKFNDAWKGEGIWIVRTIEDVQELIGFWRWQA